MKRLSAKMRVEAFTLIEVLVVIVIVFVIGAMLLPSFTNRSKPAYRTVCLNNQKQIALGFTIWNDDNNRLFPWQVSVANNGTMELIANGQVSSQFQPLSYCLKNISAFICPSDKTRQAPKDYQTMSNQNISYFVNVDVSTKTSNTILTGDRNLQVNGRAVKPGLFVLTTNLDMSWTRELHPNGGNLAFADGHVESVRTNALNKIVLRQPLTTNHLLVP